MDSSRRPDRISPAQEAKSRWESGTSKQRLSRLVLQRGGIDLLRNPSKLEQYRMGSFRIGRSTFPVYVVPRPGGDDRMEDHLIVREPKMGPNDVVTGYRTFDLGKFTIQPNE